MQNKIFIAHHRISLIVIGMRGKKRWVGLLLVIGGLLLMTPYDIQNIQIDSENFKIDGLLTSCGIFMALNKLIIFLFNRSYFSRIVNVMISDWRRECELTDTGIITYNLKRSKMVSTTVVATYNLIHIAFVLKAITSYAVDPVDKRKFLTTIKVPFSARESPVYEIINLLQFVSAVLCCNIHALIDGLLAPLVFHAGSKAHILTQEVVIFSAVCRFGDNNIMKFKALRKLIQLHLNYIKFSKDINKIFSQISLIHISFLTITQVFSGHIFIDALEKGEKLVNLLPHAALTMASLLSCGYYCIAGEYLTVQNRFISKKLYGCLWYEFKVSNQKEIILLLREAQEPVHLTFGKFHELSYGFLCKIIKVSYSYLSLVRAKHQTNRHN